MNKQLGSLGYWTGKMYLTKAPSIRNHIVMLKSLQRSWKVSVEELIGNKELLSSIDSKEFTDIEHYTFQDIINELKKPGRDPRKATKVLEFDARINKIEDLISGMELNGMITNVTAFGAFVNLGIKENGLLHKSNMSDSYVDDPSEVVRLNQHVKVKVLEVDVARKRIGLALLEG